MDVQPSCGSIAASNRSASAAGWRCFPTTWWARGSKRPGSATAGFADPPREAPAGPVRAAKVAYGRAEELGSVLASVARRLIILEPESAVSCPMQCPMQLPRSDRQSRLPRAVMTLATAVVSGRVKMERSALIFDTGAGCRRNRDGVPYAVSAADRRWSCAAA